MTQERELALVRRVQAGDTAAFEPLVSAYEKRAYNQALQLMRHPQDAEDAVQESFLKAFRSIGEFRGDSKFSVWLHRIIHNTCLDLLRKQGRERTEALTETDDEGQEVQQDVADYSLSPETLLEQKMTREAVRRGIESLPPDHRQILLLRELQGLSYEEIASVLGLEAGTVKSRIFRARKKLCTFLLEDGNIPDLPTSGEVKGGGTR